MNLPARLLLIDDDPLFTGSIASFLGNAGHDVRTSAEIDELLEPPLAADLLLLGRPRPRIPIVDLLGEIRRRSAVPIILIGEGTQLADRIRALESGADDVVAKPLSPRELSARITNLLRRSARAPARPPAAPRRPVLRFAGWSLDPESRLLTSSNGLAVPLPEDAFGLLAHYLEHPQDPSAREALMAHVGLKLTSRTLDADDAPPARPRPTIRGVAHLLESC